MFNWDDLRVFLEVSKTLNLSRAAEELEVDQTTVYRRISRFEKKLGKKLFKRTANTYILTSWGEGLVRKSSHLQDEMSKIDNFLGDNLTDLFGTINITTTDVIANVVLPPLLARFHKLYPHLQLDITVCEDFFDMYRREADLAIRSSDSVEPHVYALKVGRGAWALYGAKDYLKGRPAFNSPGFFTKNSFIAGSEKIEHIKSNKWLRSKVREENISLKASSMQSVYAAVKAGIGIGLLPCVYKDMDNSLIEISERFDNFGSPIWLITQKELIGNEKMKICLDFFQKELGKIFQY
jgi:DNA-binding transcriptional LysR family regulator